MNRMVSLNSFKITIRKGKAYPKFASAELESELQKAREIYEKNLGSKEKNFDESEIDECFSRSKTSDAAKLVLGRYYSFNRKGLTDLFDEKSMQRLSKMGISNCTDLRLRFFKFLSHDHSGFMSSEAREDLIHQFANKIEVDDRELDQALWMDEKDNRILERVGDPPEDLGSSYNFEMLSNILANSFSLQLGPVKRPSSARFIYRNVKFYGLIHETGSGEDGFEFLVPGPLELFDKKSSKFGYRMSSLVCSLYRLSEKRDFDCQLSINFKKSKRKVKFEFQISETPRVDHPEPEDLRLKLVDGKIEAKLVSTLKALKMDGWHIDCEPEIFTYGDSAFIPDLSLCRGELEIPIHLIGYWKSEYGEIKDRQLQDLEESKLENLILIVDGKQKEDFESMTEFPIFTYSKQGSSYKVPYPRIMGYLQKRYPRADSSENEEESNTQSRIVRHHEGNYKVYW